MELIKLEPYKHDWKLEFESESRLIRDVLGVKVEKIHHVGSTAVEDLQSKPIIDMAIESSEFPPSQETIDKFESIGYRYKGESGIKGRIWFIKGQPRKFNLHFCALNSEIVNNQIRFREELKNNVKLRREYEKLKISHAVGKHIDDTEYALLKTKLIESVLRKDKNETQHRSDR